MKFFIGLLMAVVAVNGVLALPAGSPNDDAEVIDVPRQDKPKEYGEDSNTLPFPGFDGVIDTGAGYPFLQPHPIGFSFNLGFFDAFEDILRHLRTRLWSIPEESDDASTDVDSPFKNGNTTSTVKVVDGHRIEINETVYGDENNMFKVRLVNIQPLNSGDDVAETDTNNQPTNPNPVTAGPNRAFANRNNNNNDDDDDNDDNDRREPLSKKTDDENEIRGNIDEHLKNQQLLEQQQQEQEQQQQHNTMLPTTNEDNASSLNAAFVTDNSLEQAEYASVNGNIEAETNKPENGNFNATDSAAFDAIDDLDHSGDGAAAALDVELVEDIVSKIRENERLTIENNEETELNDNFNESTQDDDDSIAAPTTAMDAEATTSTATEAEADAEAEAEIDEFKVPTTMQSSNAEFFGETGENAGNNDDATSDANADVNESEDEDEAVAVDINSGASHSNYAINKHREDLSSSDDEDGDGEAIEMSPAFHSEWAHLAEELANVNDKNNDLSNDIDAYESVPIDLSNDIAVNDIAAAQGDFPHNPDAEFIDVDADVDGVLMSGTQPQFERLTIDAASQPMSEQIAAEEYPMQMK